MAIGRQGLETLKQYGATKDDKAYKYDPLGVGQSEQEADSGKGDKMLEAR